MCVCACGSGVEGWVFSLAAFRYTGTAMESAVELLPSKDNHGKREERASLVAQRLKRLPAMLETRVQSLGWEDPLEQDMVAHTSILAWRIPMDRGPGGLQSMGSQRVGHHRSD